MAESKQESILCCSDIVSAATITRATVLYAMANASAAANSAFWRNPIHDNGLPHHASESLRWIYSLLQCVNQLSA